LAADLSRKNTSNISEFQEKPLMGLKALSGLKQTHLSTQFREEPKREIRFLEKRGVYKVNPSVA
jgi:hypothetical protein